MKDTIMTKNQKFTSLIYFQISSLDGTKLFHTVIPSMIRLQFRNTNFFVVSTVKHNES